MKKLNKLSRIISMTITVCMLIGICSVSVVFADSDRIYADPVYDYYETVDADTAADNTFGIYMEEKYANLKYNPKSFVAKGSSSNGLFVAIAWPPSLKERTEGDGYPAQNATITNIGSDYIIKSINSNVKYKMPERITPTDEEINSGDSFDLAEAMIIDYKLTTSAGVGKLTSGAVNIGKSYEKIHILIGHASTSSGGSYGNGQIQAHVVYDDETTTLPEDVGVRMGWEGKNRYSFPAELRDVPESDGRNGYICESLPIVTASGQSGADNFVADFVSYISPSGMASNSTGDYQGQFVTTNNSCTFAAYEYTLTLNPEKTVSKIIFSQTSGTGGYAVLGISGENDREDWTDKVAEINTAIENLETKGAASEASDVVNAMEMVNSAIEAGLESYIDVDKFNSLFADGEFTGNLIDAVLAEVDLENVTWDDTTDTFKDLDDVVSVIDETGNLDTCPAKEDALKAYEGMVDSLINEEIDNDKMIERFELLKSAKTPAFRTIFEDKIIYNETTPSLKSSIELITFDVDFSKLVDKALLVKDNFEVVRGGDKIDNSWITIKPKFVDENSASGVVIEVLNSQDYSKEYTLKVSRDVKGINGEAWGYQLTSKGSVISPYTATISNLKLKSDRTFSGTITLNNLTGSEISSVAMIMSYDENGECLGAIYVCPANGVAARGENKIDFTETLHEDAKEVICYIYDSVASMTLLTPPEEIDISAL